MKYVFPKYENINFRIGIAIEKLRCKKEGGKKWFQ